MKSFRSLALFVALCALSSPVSARRHRWPNGVVVHYIQKQQQQQQPSSSVVPPAPTVDTSLPIIEGAPVQAKVEKLNVDNPPIPTGSSSTSESTTEDTTKTTTKTAGDITCGDLQGTLLKMTLGGSGFTWRTENGKAYCSGGSKCTEGNAGDNTCGKDATSCCITESGAVFVAKSEAATYKASTKIECSAKDDFSWCNISLVDGYSVPAFCGPSTGKCNSGEAGSGGTQDLLTLGTCPGSGVIAEDAQIGAGNCPNPQSQSNSAPDFFAKGGDYWINTDKADASLCQWASGTTASCTAGVSSSSKMMAREVEGEAEAEVLEKRDAHAHRSRHGRLHAKAVS